MHVDEQRKEDGKDIGDNRDEFVDVRDTVESSEEKTPKFPQILKP